MDNGKRLRTQRQLSDIENMWSQTNEELEGSMSGLCLEYNPSAYVPFLRPSDQTPGRPPYQANTTLTREILSLGGCEKRAICYLWNTRGPQKRT